LENIVVYGRSYPKCSYCDNLKTLLKEKNISYVYKDITDEAIYEEFCNFKLRTVPAVFINDTFVGGYTEMSGLVKEC